MGAFRWQAVRRRARKDAKELAQLVADPGERARFLRRLGKPSRMNVRQQHAFVVIVLLLMVGLWAAGAMALRGFAPEAARPWDAVWGLAAVSFLAAVAIPVPGATSALLISLAESPWLLAAGVLGAAAGGTAGAAVVHYIGGALLRGLEKRAKRNGWSRALLKAGERFAHHWTYLGIAVLVSLPFMPRSAIFYVASILGLKLLPYLAAAFLGHLVRNSLVAAGVDLAARFL